MENNKYYIDDKSTIIGDCIIDENTKVINSTLKNVVVGKNVVIENSHIENSTVLENCAIGPYARIRDNSYISSNVKIGNFVEIKNSFIGERTKVSHLSYVGDASIGEDVNIGAGVIFVNYDGKNKNKIVVGDKVFIGCNSSLIAPIFLEDESFVGAGSTITKNVESGSIAKSRVEQQNCEYKNNLYLENFMKTPKYFGTDGIRGKISEHITKEFAKSLGFSISKLKENVSVLIGCDTRPSGKELKQGLCEGLFVGGAECYDAGVCTTGMISFLTRKLNFDYGIMITASHNSIEYNGFKIFETKGYKISKSVQLKIEENLHKINKKSRKNVKKIEKSAYFDLIYDIFCEKEIKTKVFLDTANGSACEYAKKFLSRLGANVCNINEQGEINKNASVLDENVFKRNMKNSKADIGFCFDGDADRIMAITKNLIVLTGDHILFILAKYFDEKYLVGTIMTNLGIEKYLKKNNMHLIKTDVGDSNISKIVMSKKYKIGAERSGHVILGDFLPTGDGILVMILLLKIFNEKPELFIEAENIIQYKSVEINVICMNKKILNNSEVKKCINSISKDIKEEGSVIVRYSGTEPKIRITVQHMDTNMAYDYANKIKSCIESFNLFD